MWGNPKKNLFLHKVRRAIGEEAGHCLNCPNGIYGPLSITLND